MDESSTSRADAAIAETRATFVAALKDGDAATASTVYADEARLLAPSTELIEGRKAIAAFWRAGLEAGISGVELQALEVKRESGLAYEIGRYSLELQPARAETIVDRGKYLLVHERQPDGSWRRAVEMFNPDAPPAHWTSRDDYGLLRQRAVVPEPESAKDGSRRGVRPGRSLNRSTGAGRAPRAVDALERESAPDVGSAIVAADPSPFNNNNNNRKESRCSQ